ncbi:hypothetical protein [Massilia aquatica]|uniref:hypothetical protein n=1 Tax=Massilia aquatica TaxID=2609000 RepID=UPI0014205388|nr:hypothetical protein [Massilia aquatica]
MSDSTGLDNPDPTALGPFIAELHAYFASPPDPADVGRHGILAQSPIWRGSGMTAG